MILSTSLSHLPKPRFFSFLQRLNVAEGAETHGHFPSHSNPSSILLHHLFLYAIPVWREKTNNFIMEIKKIHSMVEYIERGLPGSGKISHKVHLFQSIELLASSIPLQQHPGMHCQRIQGLPRLLSRRSCFLRLSEIIFRYL